MKNQPLNINPLLWKRFLYKKKYNGTYIQNGVTICVTHNKLGSVETIKGGILEIIPTNSISYSYIKNFNPFKIWEKVILGN